MEDLTISVIVPIYNVGTFLNKCIESIIEQTYKNIEIILVDDGSKDNSGAICDYYAKKDSRIKVIHKKNGGLVSARRAGVEKSVGQYIAYVDGDDWVDNTWLSKIAKIIESYGPDIIECDAFKSLNGKNIELQVSEFEGLYHKEDLGKKIIPFMMYDKRKNFYHFGILPAVWSKVIKSSILKKNLCSEDKITFGEDVACVYNCLLDCNSFYGLRESLYYYRQNNQSMTKAYDCKRFERISVLFEYLEKNLLNENENIRFQFEHYKLFCIFYAILNEAKSPQKIKKIANRIKCGIASVDKENFLKKCSIKKISIPWNIMLFLLRRKSFVLLAILCKAVVKLKYSFKE